MGKDGGLAGGGVGGGGLPLHSAPSSQISSGRGASAASAKTESDKEILKDSARIGGKGESCSSCSQPVSAGVDGLLFCSSFVARCIAETSIGKS